MSESRSKKTRPRARAGFVTESRHWYKDRYRSVLMLTLVLVPFVLVSMSLNIFLLFFNQKPPKYFAATPDLRLVEMVSTDVPLISQAGLLNWSTEVVSSTLTLDFLNWRKQLMSVKKHYFKDTFNGLVANLKSSDILTLIESQRLNLKSIVQQSPVVINEGMLSGTYSWNIQFPILLSYESSKGVQNTQNLIVQILVQRTSTIDHPQGVKIKRIVLKNK
jgi:intracellular multiplication protein IcmL